MRETTAFLINIWWIEVLLLILRVQCIRCCIATSDTFIYKCLINSIKSKNHEANDLHFTFSDIVYLMR